MQGLRDKKLKKTLKDENVSQEDIKNAYTKARRPYFNMTLQTFDPNNVTNGAFELDYNEFFFEAIKNSREFPPYMLPDDRIDYWFNERCKQMAMETYENAYTTELGYSSVKTHVREDGKTEYY